MIKCDCCGKVIRKTPKVYYCSDPCQSKGQSARQSKFFKHKGKSLTVRGWAKELGISHEAIYKRLRKGYSMEDIIKTPRLPLGRRKWDLK